MRSFNIGAYDNCGGNSWGNIDRMRPSLIQPNSRGFTVLELLIAITLLSLLMVIVGVTMRLGYRSVDSGTKKIDTIERFRNSLSLIDSQIQSLTPMTEGDGAEKKFFFAGEHRSLTFSTTVSIWGDLRGPTIVCYHLEPDNQGKQSLYVSENIIGMERKRDVLLLTAFDDLFFEYYHRFLLDEEGTWTDTWREGAIIPEKVRIHLINGAMERIYDMPIRVTATLSQGRPIYTVYTIK